MSQVRNEIVYFPVVRVIDMVAGFEPTSKTARSWFVDGINGIKWRIKSGGGRPYSSVQWTLEFIYAVNGRKPPRGARRLEPYTRLRPIQEACKIVLSHEVDYSTIWRWHEPDGDGPRLKSYTLGRRRLTTVENVEKFLKRTHRSTGGEIVIPEAKKVTAQSLAHLPADMLEALGIKVNQMTGNNHLDLL